MNRRKGAFVISLDFELLWGGIEKRSPDGYGKTNVAHVDEVIQHMLRLFEKYGIHVTFATVGLIMLSSKKEAIHAIPLVQPSYQRSELSPYSRGYLNNIQSEDEYLYFAPHIVEMLNNVNNIEIGTHTFCHYYCWEEGQTIEEFDADIAAAVRVAKQRNININSVVFPRNEVNEDYLSVCSRYGINVYRGNAKRFFNPVKGRWGRLLQRMLRFTDTYVNIGGHDSYMYSEISAIHGCLNIPASRFLRPYNKRLRMLENLRSHRIKEEIRYAAKHGEIYHLWWHPHNFGCDMFRNLSFLEEILKEYVKCNKRYGMMSYTMSEMADIIKDKVYGC